MLFQLSIANISGPFHNPIDMIFVFAVYIVSRFVQNFEQRDSVTQISSSSYNSLASALRGRSSGLQWPPTKSQ